MRVALVLMSCLAACADESPRRLLDLEGPEGRLESPGPWPVEVLATTDRADLWVQFGDGAFERLELQARGADRFRGRIDDVPVGTRVRYYAEAEGERLPETAPGRARVFEVVAPGASGDAATPAGCALRFRRPSDGARLGPADDGAPQAGLQVTVVVQTNLVDGVPARLDVDGTGYAGEAGSGIVAFADVTLTPGPHELAVEGRQPGGPPCSASIRVEAAGPPAPGP